MVSRVSFRVLVIGCLIAVTPGVRLVAQSLPQASPPAWTLEQVLAAAAVQQPLIEQARARVTAAEGSRLTATTLPNPVGTFFVENGRFPGQGPLPVVTESSIYATLPLEPFLQRSSRINVASADLQAANADLARTERAVALDAARAYYRLALAQASLDALGENRRDLEQMLTYLGARVTQGATPEADLIRVQVERDRLDTEIALADVDVVRARAALRPFIGLDRSAGDFLVASPAALGATPLPPLQEWSSRASTRRPELVEARARVTAATSAVSVARSSILKEWGASFGVKRSDGTNGMIAGVGITMPIFDRNRGEIQRASAERIEAAQDVTWQERLISAEVDAAYTAATRLVTQTRALQPAFLARAAESRQIAVGAYQEGAGTLLQVLDASRALSDARLICARALIGANQSLFELGLAAGDDPMTAARIGHDGAATDASTNRDGGVR